MCKRNHQHYYKHHKQAVLNRTINYKQSNQIKQQHKTNTRNQTKHTNATITQQKSQAVKQSTNKTQTLSTQQYNKYNQHKE